LKNLLIWVAEIFNDEWMEKHGFYDNDTIIFTEQEVKHV